MRLLHLSLTNFRNFARLDVAVPGGSVLLVGGNAQGKTSLLESIYYLATFTSFQAARDRELINFMASREPLAAARIQAEVQRLSSPLKPQPSTTNHRLEVRLIQQLSERQNGAFSFRKEVLIDGVARKIGEAVGFFNAVLFLPHMLMIIEGPPEERRRYLNLAISQVWPHYAEFLVRYHRALTQRNALLKQINERGGDISQLKFWDEQVAQWGSQIVFARIQTLQELEKIATRLHLELTKGKEVLRLVYQPSFDPLPQQKNQIALPMDTPLDRSHLTREQIFQQFLLSLQAHQVEEIARGMTLIGPHRDELRFLGDGIDIGTYGSRGQTRTTMLSMKLAEVEWMKQRTGQPPVLLLDEVLAELDPQRREDLLRRLKEQDQVLMTTTDLDLFTADFLSHTEIWRIEEGRICKEDRTLR